MKLKFQITMAVAFTGLAAGLMLWHVPAQAQEPAAKQAAKERRLRRLLRIFQS